LDNHAERYARNLRGRVGPLNHKPGADRRPAFYLQETETMTIENHEINRLNMTPAQSCKLAAIYHRPATWWGADRPETYREFYASAFPMLCDDAIAVPGPAGMYIVIEPDGYAHT
jgi:hypothetical protein